MSDMYLHQGGRKLSIRGMANGLKAFLEDSANVDLDIVGILSEERVQELISKYAAADLKTLQRAVDEDNPLTAHNSIYRA